MYDTDNIKRQIESLPRGYITRKRINNKIYYYHQWIDDDGKEICRTVSEDEAVRLKELIEERKYLSRQLRSIQSYMMVEEPGDFYNVREFNLNALYGSSLKQMASIAKGLKKRDCYSMIEGYLYGVNEDKVCLIYGLRRTGKTTMIRQAILDMNEEDLSRTIYLKATQRNTIEDLNKDLIKIKLSDYRYVFIDEVTLIEDFSDSASLLSDVFAASGMKIVMSGTDSLGFYFAVNDELYDRAVMVHTTYIPYREHERLLQISGVDEYLRYGGTLKAGELDFESKELNTKEASFRDDESTRRYIDTAICRNIQHALMCYQDGGHFRHLKELYEKGELTNAINRIIEDINHEFAAKIITRSFTSRDLKSAASLLRKEKDVQKRTNVLDMIDTSDINSRLMKILDIHNKDELTVNITDTTASEIKEYLEALDLIYTADIETVGESDEPLEKVIFTQPGMRFVQAQALVYALMKDRVFDTLSEKEKQNIINKIIEDVEGRMLEDIVLLETIKTLPGYKRAFKLQFAAGEYDMVIYDEMNNSCEIFEVKHSDKMIEEQWHSLNDQDKLSKTEQKYGKITKKTVLYNGETCRHDDKCWYRNVAEYLRSL